MENTTPEATPIAAPQPELTISDLQNLRALIEATVRRGAFQAQELSSVGLVYDKLNNFLNAVSTPAQPENQ